MSSDARIKFYELLVIQHRESKLGRAVAHARELGGKYFPIMADQLEKFVKEKEVKPITVDSLDDVFKEIQEKIWGIQEVREVGQGRIPPNPVLGTPSTTYSIVKATATDGTILEMIGYWEDMARYLAFQPKRT